MISVSVVSLCLVSLFPFFARAQELYVDEQGVWRATVIRILETEEETLPGLDIPSTRQFIEVRLRGGERDGETLRFWNDHPVLSEGDRIFVVYTKTIDGAERYRVQDMDRTVPLAALALLFMVAVVGLSGLQGVRSLISLAGSIAAILFVLIPLLLAGFPPVATSIVVAAGILAIAILVTHGVNRRSLVALLGTWSAIIITGLLAHGFIAAAHLTGFASDESIYLNASTKGALDFIGLLLGAIIIGAIGVLDDIAITQVAVVRELSEHDASIPPLALYRKALRVGKEHVGALVNTLVLAYTGAALPLLLLFTQVDAAALTILNQEVIATEILRTLVGSIGLILTVPITTGLAVLFRGKLGKGGEEHFHVHHHGAA
jgi:uncharacterized membrane protein